MRRFLFWYLPLFSALTAAALFGRGFYSYLRGDLGTAVTLLQTPAPPSAAVHASDRISAIILGDSLARGTGDSAGLGIAGRLDQELRHRNIRAGRTVNLAVNGARTADLLRQIDRPNVRALIGQANVIIVSIGGNDLWGGGEARQASLKNPDGVMNGVIERMVRVVAAVQTSNPRARIFIVGLYNPFVSTPLGQVLGPLVSRWNARLSEKFSDNPRIVVVQTADLFLAHDRLAFDRFHPSGEGYALIARRIADAI